MGDLESAQNGEVVQARASTCSREATSTQNIISEENNPRGNDTSLPDPPVCGDKHLGMIADNQNGAVLDRAPSREMGHGSMGTENSQSLQLPARDEDEEGGSVPCNTSLGTVDGIEMEFSIHVANNPGPVMMNSRRDAETAKLGESMSSDPEILESPLEDLLIEVQNNPDPVPCDAASHRSISEDEDHPEMAPEENTTGKERDVAVPSEGNEIVRDVNPVGGNHQGSNVQGNALENHTCNSPAENIVGPEARSSEIGSRGAQPISSDAECLQTNQASTKACASTTKISTTVQCATDVAKTSAGSQFSISSTPAVSSAVQLQTRTVIAKTDTIGTMIGPAQLNTLTTATAPAVRSNISVGNSLTTVVSSTVQTNIGQANTRDKATSPTAQPSIEPTEASPMQQSNIGNRNTVISATQGDTGHTIASSRRQPNVGTVEPPKTSWVPYVQTLTSAFSFVVPSGTAPAALPSGLTSARLPKTQSFGGLKVTSGHVISPVTVVTAPIPVTPVSRREVTAAAPQPSVVHSAAAPAIDVVSSMSGTFGVHSQLVMPRNRVLAAPPMTSSSVQTVSVPIASIVKPVLISPYSNTKTSTMTRLLTSQSTIPGNNVVPIKPKSSTGTSGNRLRVPNPASNSDSLPKISGVFGGISSSRLNELHNRGTVTRTGEYLKAVSSETEGDLVIDLGRDAQKGVTSDAGFCVSPAAGGDADVTITGTSGIFRHRSSSSACSSPITVIKTEKETTGYGDEVPQPHIPRILANNKRQRKSAITYRHVSDEPGYVRTFIPSTASQAPLVSGIPPLTSNPALEPRVITPYNARPFVGQHFPDTRGVTPLYAGYGPVPQRASDFGQNRPFSQRQSYNVQGVRPSTGNQSLRSLLGHHQGNFRQGIPPRAMNMEPRFDAPRKKQRTPTPPNFPVVPPQVGNQKFLQVIPQDGANKSIQLPVNHILLSLPPKTSAASLPGKPLVSASPQQNAISSVASNHTQLLIPVSMSGSTSSTGHAGQAQTMALVYTPLTTVSLVQTTTSVSSSSKAHNNKPSSDTTLTKIVGLDGRIKEINAQPKHGQRRVPKLTAEDKKRGFDLLFKDFSPPCIPSRDTPAELKLRQVRYYYCPGCKSQFITKRGFEYHFNRESMVIVFRDPLNHSVKTFYNKCQFQKFYQTPDLPQYQVQHTTEVSALPEKFIMSEEYMRLRCSAFMKEGLSHVVKQDRHMRSILAKMTADQTNDDCEIVQISKGDDTPTPETSPTAFGKYPWCPECFEVCRTKTGMLGHFTKSSADGVYECNKCLVAVNTKCATVAHIRIHDRLRPFVCPECGMTIHGEREIFLKHLKRQCFHFNRFILFDCPKCDSKFHIKQTWNEHIRDAHTEVYHKCLACPMAFKGLLNFLSHKEKLHDNKADFKLIAKCPLCDKVFNNILRYTNHHLPDHINKPSVCFKCLPCDKVFNTKGLFLEHMNAQHGEQVLRSQMCTVCGRQYRNSKGMRQHMRDKHPAVWECQKHPPVRHTSSQGHSRKPTHSPGSGRVSVIDVDSPTEEMESVSTGGSESNSPTTIPQSSPKKTCFSCPQCEVELEDESSLERHRQKHRYLAKKREAEKRPGELKVKIAKISHKVGERVKVPLSPKKKFTKQFPMLKEPEAQFVCSKCDARFYTNSDHRSHMQEAHDVLPVFPCHLCGNIYKTDALLNQHIKQHMGVTKKKPYVCWLCNDDQNTKAYPAKGMLIKHLTGVHKVPRNMIDYSKFPDVQGSDVKEENPDDPTKRKRSIESPLDGELDEAQVKRLKVTGEREFSCARCDFATNNRSDFQHHIDEHSLPGKDMLQCRECGLDFTVQPSLKKHLLMVHRVRDFSKYQQECGVDLTSAPQELPLHTLAHIKQKVIKLKDNTKKAESVEQKKPSSNECTVCYKVFDNPNTLQKHMRNHGMAFIRSKRMTFM